MSDRQSPCGSGHGRLGDTVQRDYARKLSLFNAFAAPELRSLIRELRLRPGMRVLDAGCGSGEALEWLFDAVRPGGVVTGIDLSAAHVAAARRRAPAPVEVHAGDLALAAFPPRSFDLVWCIDTIHHLRDPSDAIRSMLGWLRPDGRLVLGQSCFLPDMFFAWDARLERCVNDAVHRYYRDRYGLDERNLRDVRALVGQLRRAGARDVHTRTITIERWSPLDADAHAYLLEAIFRDTWGERLRDYLTPEDGAELERLTDPRHPDYALARPDFHFLRTFTCVTGAP
jgi:SAM-dependent methyltransferase